MSTQVNLGFPLPVNDLPSFDEESTRLWSRSWVAVGVEEMISEPGEVLPATIGIHGVHILRGDDGSLDAGYNAFQQGSCWTIPVQCGNGAKVDCPYVSCGHSRDGGVLSPQNESHKRLIRQVVGARPAKRALLPFERVGSILFTAMPGNGLEQLNNQFSQCFEIINDLEDQYSFQGHIRQEITTNWRYVGETLKDLITKNAGTGVKLVSAPPNLTVVITERWKAILIVKPVNFSRSEALVAIYGRDDDAAWSIDWKRILRKAGHETCVETNPIATWAESFFRKDDHSDG